MVLIKKTTAIFKYPILCFLFYTFISLWDGGEVTYIDIAIKAATSVVSTIGIYSINERE